MDCGQERSCVFGVSCCDASPLLEIKEGIFDEMTQFIEPFVVFPLVSAVAFGRNDRGHPLRLGLMKNIVGIVRAIRE
jgi:hypothetical protein